MGLGMGMVTDTVMDVGMDLVMGVGLGMDLVMGMDGMNIPTL